VIVSRRKLCQHFLWDISGEVVENFDLVKKIESYGSDSGKTAKKVTIVNSGTV